MRNKRFYCLGILAALMLTAVFSAVFMFQGAAEVHAETYKPVEKHQFGRAGGEFETDINTDGIWSYYATSQGWPADGATPIADKQNVTDYNNGSFGYSAGGAIGFTIVVNGDNGGNLTPDFQTMKMPLVGLEIQKAGSLMIEIAGKKLAESGYGTYLRFYKNSDAEFLGETFIDNVADTTGILNNITVSQGDIIYMYALNQDTYFAGANVRVDYTVSAGAGTRTEYPYGYQFGGSSGEFETDANNTEGIWSYYAAPSPFADNKLVAQRSETTPITSKVNVNNYDNGVFGYSDNGAAGFRIGVQGGSSGILSPDFNSSDRYMPLVALKLEAGGYLSINIKASKLVSSGYPTYLRFYKNTDAGFLDEKIVDAAEEQIFNISAVDVSENDIIYMYALNDDTYLAGAKVAVKYSVVDQLPVNVTEVQAVNAGNLKYGDTLPSLTCNSGDVDGTAALDAGQILLPLKTEYNWIFTPSDAEKYMSVYGTITLNVSRAGRVKPVVEIEGTDYASIMIKSVLFARFGIIKTADIGTGNIEWQDGNIFKGLDSETSYSLYVKIAQDDYYNESISEPAAAVTKSADTAAEDHPYRYIFGGELGGYETDTDNSSGIWSYYATPSAFDGAGFLIAGRNETTPIASKQNVTDIVNGVFGFSAGGAAGFRIGVNGISSGILSPDFNSSNRYMPLVALTMQATGSLTVNIDANKLDASGYGTYLRFYKNNDENFLGEVLIDSALKASYTLSDYSFNVYQGDVIYMYALNENTFFAGIEATVSYTVNKSGLAPVKITAIQVTGSDNLKYNDPLPAMTCDSGSAAGTIALDAGQVLSPLKGEYKWTFTPEDTGAYSTVFGTVLLNVSKADRNKPVVEEKSVKAFSIEIEEVSGALYGIIKTTDIGSGTVSWQSSAVFTNLDSLVSYTLYIKIAQNDYYEEIISDGSEIVTTACYLITFKTAGQNDVVLKFDPADKKSFIFPEITGKTGYTAAWDKIDLTGIDTDTVINAVYTAISYKISYNLNGGSGAADANYTVEDSVTLPADITRDQYTFKGWYESSDFSGNPVTEISKGTTGNKTYYAKWEKNAKNGCKAVADFSGIGFVFTGLITIALYTVMTRKFATDSLVKKENRKK